MKAFFSYVPDSDGFELHTTAAEAEAAAAKALQSRKDEAGDDGWAEDTPHICWGQVRGAVVETARAELCQVEDCDGECGEEFHHNRRFDEWVDYELRAVFEPATNRTGVNPAEPQQ